MNAKPYFLNIVVPLYERHLAHPNAVDLNFAAAIATYHIIDYLATEQGKTATELRIEIEQFCPEFNALYAVATARKHSVVEHSGPHKGLSADHTLKKEAIFIGGQALAVGGRMVATPPSVTTSSGTSVYVHEALEKTIAYLKLRFA